MQAYQHKKGAMEQRIAQLQAMGIRPEAIQPFQQKLANFPKPNPQNPFKDHITVIQQNFNLEQALYRYELQHETHMKAKTEAKEKLATSLQGHVAAIQERYQREKQVFEWDYAGYVQQAEQEIQALQEAFNKKQAEIR